MNDTFENNNNERKPISVTMLNYYLEQYLRREDYFNNLYIKGELSLRKPFTENMHSYFTLKDEESEIPCVIWKNNVPFEKLKDLKNGDEVLVRGRVNFWKIKGALSIVITDINSLSLGDINKKLEELKRKLYDEGLFDADKKKNLPPFPKNVGIIAGKDSAAYNDIIKTIREKNELVNLYFFPAIVQGKTSPQSLINRLDQIEEKFDFLDFVIISRGGGSIEDLYGFNDENLVRRIYKFSLPICSGVGHEIDTCLVDFVCDKSFITPTEAANRSIPDIEDFLLTIDDCLENLKDNIKNKIDDYTSETELLSSKNLSKLLTHKLNESVILLNSFNKDALKEELLSRLNNYSFSLDKSIHSIVNNIKNKVTKLDAAVESSFDRLRLKSPNEILKIGYTLLLGEDKKVKKLKTLKKNEKVKAVFNDGEADLKVL